MNNKILKKDCIFLDVDVKSRDEAFSFIADQALNMKLITNKEALIKGFKNRELEGTTGFEDGFAIPHAKIKEATKPACLIIKLKKAIDWNSMDKKPTQYLFALIIPEGKADEHMSMLSDIATKLMFSDFKNAIINAKTHLEIIKAFDLEGEKLKPLKNNEKVIKVVGISACPTGVAHTYMARTALLKAGENLGWSVKIETQGQKGQEFKLTDKEIEEADVVFLAIDITIDKTRFIGKKVYQVSTKKTLRYAEEELKKSLEEAHIYSSNNSKNDFKTETTKKQKQSWVQHLMSGISYMIPFIVFAGLTSAIIAGAANAAGVNLSNKASLQGFWIFAWHLNEFANIGFSVMFAISGAYIANSIAGRAAIAPAFILVMIGNNPHLVWQGYFQNVMVQQMGPNGEWINGSINDVMQPLNIFGAVIFGLSVGYTIKWINTKWKINQYIQPIMPIIIIPVFLTLIFAILYMFTFGPIIGIAIGYLYTGILSIEKSGVGMILVGLILGLLSGVDMGGPINKIASFGATAMIPIDGGLAMGCSAAAFAVAPLGAGLATMVFGKTFKNDKEMGINATILGFMGVSESAIPFAIKYKWAAIIPNIICSGIAGLLAGAFMVQGHVGAWGGPIIAVFAGVTDSSGNFIGILWYLIAISAGTFVHIILFRILVEVQVKGTKGTSLKSIFKKTKKIEKEKTTKKFVEKL
ncbi:PTS system, fructose-specific IIA component [Williamsoniiplasma somnilux]|uniref:PTS system, fructose-specific IIA component n=1 Tax=Williamsoniiplasma somnilux TaxID=215578 RepID=A0A2K8NY86_9MOLU|nr:fructose PTS transporter subunit IIA [Williamsoniiplasma somnilux]ATZ18704.1 PTS system, fructose-specific IIA component [Williamsoniiplasma somnilux]